jgi:hypothetical protein
MIQLGQEAGRSAYLCFIRPSLCKASCCSSRAWDEEGSPVMILYTCPFSGNGYKVRLFAALSRQDLHVRDVDLAAGEALPGYVHGGCRVKQSSRRVG